MDISEWSGEAIATVSSNEPKRRNVELWAAAAFIMLIRGLFARMRAEAERKGLNLGKHIPARTRSYSYSAWSSSVLGFRWSVVSVCSFPPLLPRPWQQAALT